MHILYTSHMYAVTALKSPRQKVPGQKPPRQKSPDNKPPRNIEEIIVKYTVDANLFRQGSINLKKKIQPLFFLFFWAFIPVAYCRRVFDLDSCMHSYYVCTLYKLCIDMHVHFTRYVYTLYNTCSTITE